MTPRSSEASASPGRSSRLIWTTFAVVVAAWVLLDQVTKALAVAALSDGAIDLVVLDLRLVRNPNAAFGIPGFPGMFLIVAIVVIALILKTLPMTDRLSLAFAYGLITGGALGNAIDRVVRAPGFPGGHVVDFFDLRWWPVFNVADIGITTGAALIVFIAIRLQREDEQVVASAADSDATSG